jgi:hypothetical protein
MNVYWADNPEDSEAVVRAKARRIVDYVLTLDGNSISVSFPFFTGGPRASTVYAGRSTPTPRRVGIVLDELHRSGVRTTLRPLLDERSLMAMDRHDWRGNIEPASRDRWFASYQELIAPYVRAAHDNHAATFIVATELNSLEGDRRWGALISQVRRVFGGEIGYAANWDSYISRPIDMRVDRLSVNAYFPLDVGDDASVGTLVRGWDQWLDRRTRGALPGLVFSEVGAQAESGGYRHPGIWGTAGRPINLAVQQRWFTAACHVARQRAMVGLYWWKLDFHVNPARVDPERDTHDSFVGRPAEDAIHSCFSAWGSSSR